MASFFFPCVMLRSQSDEQTTEAGDYKLHKRLWQTSTFDVATLASSHSLHVDWHLVNSFFGGVNCEIEAQAESREAAQKSIAVLHAMLYVHGVEPFIMPFVVSHSINDYSGINSRDGGYLDSLPIGLREGLTSKTGRVELWLHEPTLRLTGPSAPPNIDAGVFKLAVHDLSKWRDLEERFKQLGTLRRALFTAPFIPDLSSSLLHFWQGIEALVQPSSEISFRLALYVAQLAGGVEPTKSTYTRMRQGYSVRSKAAHGNIAKLTMTDWVEARSLAVLCLRAVLSRDKLPHEEQLLAEVLAFSS